MHWKLELRTTYDSNVARVKEKVYKCVFWLIANAVSYTHLTLPTN